MCIDLKWFTHLCTISGVVGVLYVGCVFAETSAEPTREPIKIGALLHVTGEFAVYGNAFLEGALLAVDEVNAAAEATAPIIELVLEDTQYRSAVTNAASQRLLKISKVFAAIVTTAHEAKTAGPLFESAKVPLVSLWDSAPELDAIGSYVFGIGTWAPASGEQSAKEAFNRFKARRAAVFVSSTDWAVSVAEPFERQFKILGGEIVSHETIDPGTSDVRSILLRVKAQKPDVVYALIDDNIPAFFRQVRNTKFEVPILTSDIITEDLLREDPGLFEGIYQTQSVEPDSVEAERVRSAYRRKFNQEPGFFVFTAWGYDGVRLLARAFQQAECTARACNREKVKEALYATKEYAGASGPITIDRAGSSRRGVQLFVVRDSRLLRAQ